MSAAGVENLDFIETIGDRFNDSALRLGVTRDYYFQNDPKHTSHIARLWLLYNFTLPFQIASSELKSSLFNPIVFRDLEVGPFKNHFQIGFTVGTTIFLRL